MQTSKMSKYTGASSIVMLHENKQKKAMDVALIHPTKQPTGELCHRNVRCVTRTQTLRSLSLSYQKKDGRAWPRRSFFWYDTDFLEFESFDFIDRIL